MNGGSVNAVGSVGGGMRPDSVGGGIRPGITRYKGWG